MTWVPSAVWLVLLILFAVVEGITVGLVSVWFALGALAAMLVSLVVDTVWIQVLVFALVSGLALAVIRPLARKYLTPKPVATNADSLVGKTVIVTEEIDNLRGTGRVKVRDVTWAAHAADADLIIPAGQKVIIQDIKGAHVIVLLSPEGESKQRGL